MKNNDKKPGRTIAFLVTKPLQLMVAETIAEQYNSYETILLLVNHFSDFDAVYSNVKSYGRWGKVIRLESRSAALSYVLKNKSVNELYLDSDVGFRIGFDLYKLHLLSFGRVSQFVYEEGIGTYRKDLYQDGFVKNGLRMLGMGSFFGGHYLSKKIYVYKPNNYSFDSSLRPISNKIEPALQLFIQESEVRYKYYFGLSEKLVEIKGEKLIIYLTSHYIDWKFVNGKLNVLNSDFKVIKPHPHIKECISSDSFDFVIPNKIPIELFICMINGRFDDVVVYHHGSSVENYIDAINLTYVNI